MQIREQCLAVSQQSVLGRHRLLDLEQQVGVGPHLLRRCSINSAPAALKSVSVIADPSPAPACTSTSWPRRVSAATPAGVMATLNSLFLVSVGMPMRMLQV